jgi:hypothetical protein
MKIDKPVASVVAWGYVMLAGLLLLYADICIAWCLRLFE